VDNGGHTIRHGVCDVAGAREGHIDESNPEVFWCPGFHPACIREMDAPAMLSNTALISQAYTHAHTPRRASAQGVLG